MRNQGLLRIIWLTHETALKPKDENEQHNGDKYQKKEKILEDASQSMISETESDSLHESMDESEKKIPIRN